MFYYSRKLKKIRKMLQTNLYPTKFNEKRWKFIKANCYAYSLDLPVNDRKKSIFIPGCICGENTEKVIWTDVTGEVKKDLDFLGISYREEDDDGVLYNNEWRIAIYHIPNFHDFPIGFHIARQDEDGCWSEKPSWKKKINKFEDKTNIPPDLSKYGPRLEKVLILSKYN